MVSISFLWYVLLDFEQVHANVRTISPLAGALPSIALVYELLAPISGDVLLMSGLCC